MLLRSPGGRWLGGGDAPAPSGLFVSSPPGGPVAAARKWSGPSGAANGGETRPGVGTARRGGRGRGGVSAGTGSFPRPGPHRRGRGRILVAAAVGPGSASPPPPPNQPPGSLLGGLSRARSRPSPGRGPALRRQLYLRGPRPVPGSVRVRVSVLPPHPPPPGCGPGRLGWPRSTAHLSPFQNRGTAVFPRTRTRASDTPRGVTHPAGAAVGVWAGHRSPAASLTPESKTGVTPVGKRRSGRFPVLMGPMRSPLLADGFNPFPVIDVRALFLPLCSLRLRP